MSLKVTEQEAKREFIKSFNLLVALYENKLNKLEISNDKNLAVVLRNVVYGFEEIFSSYLDNVFYSSIAGRVIVLLLEEILKLEINELDIAYEMESKSSFFYNFVHIFLPKEWYVRYIALCNELANFSVSKYSDSIIQMFYAYTSDMELTEEELEDLLITFKTELIVLGGREDVMDSQYIKTIGGKR